LRKSEDESKTGKGDVKKRSEQISPGRRAVVLPSSIVEKKQKVQESWRAVEKSERNTKAYETACDGETNSKKDRLINMRARPRL